MKSELIKASIRQELSKHYDLEKDYVKFSEAEEGLTKTVIYEIENELQRLQSKVHKITGDGEVMMLFNEILGIGAGS